MARRLVDFNDSFSSEETPADQPFLTSGAVRFANDAAFTAFITGAGGTLQVGMSYYNTTTNKLRYYDGDWEDVSTADDLTDHLSDTTAAHAASAISVTPASGVAASTVQAALEELSTEAAAIASSLAGTASALAAHEADTTDVHGSTGSVVGTGGSQTITGTKTFDKELILTEIAEPSAPAAGKQAVYIDSADHKPKRKDSAGLVKTLGSGGGGSGGLNCLTLTSAWSPDNTDNFDLESSIGNWATYKDAAGTAPVDMTGGSPNSALSRTTTVGEVLNGAAGLKWGLGESGSEQGEGIACPGYVPLGYRASNLVFSGQFKVLSGTVNLNDFRPYIYDVTNSEVITPTVYAGINGSSGTFVAVFQVKSNTAQIRAGIHIARTTTGIVGLLFDDMSVSPASSRVGMAGSSWTSYTPTGSWVSNTTYSGRWRRVGDSMEIEVSASLSGAPTATSLEFSLPSGFSIDTTKLPLTSALNVIVGTAVILDSGTTRYAAVAVYNNSTSFGLIVGSSNQVSSTTPMAFANGDIVTARVTVPISGWDANVTMGESSRFNISSYLANGSRVTGSAPTTLGQYRSYIRNSNADTYTETNGAPTASPSAADGIRIYNGNAYNAADTNSEPTRYEIFVGKNKQIKWEWYASAGRTGQISVEPHSATGNDRGYRTGYDPTTGIAWVVAHRVGSSTTTHSSGLNGDGSAVANDPYFDIVVSENALAVGVQSVRSQIIYNSPSGYGSGAGTVRHFTVLESQQGTAFVGTMSATNGLQIQLTEDGIYEAEYIYDFNSASNNGSMQIYLDSTLQSQLDQETANRGSSLKTTVIGRAGQVITFRGANNNQTGTGTKAKVTKVGN